MTDPLNTDTQLIEPPELSNPAGGSSKNTKNENAALAWIAGGFVLLMFLFLIFGNFYKTSTSVFGTNYRSGSVITFAAPD